MFISLTNSERRYLQDDLKLCNTRIQDFLSAQKQRYASEKGCASMIEQNLCDKLLSIHTKLYTHKIVCFIYTLEKTKSSMSILILKQWSIPWVQMSLSHLTK